MPDRDEPLELLRELRDVGTTPPRPQVLHARVSTAVADEIEREQDTAETVTLTRPVDG